jgi:hypothetical protein
LPCIDNRLISAHSASGSYVQLLEKALANIYGNYMAVEGGTLTGYLTDFHDLSRGRRLIKLKVNFFSIDHCVFPT